MSKNHSQLGPDSKLSCHDLKPQHRTWAKTFGILSVNQGRKKEKGTMSTLSHGKEEVLSIKFQEKLEQRNESDVCTILREKTHMYVFPVCINATPPKKKIRQKPRVLEFYHLDRYSKERKRVPLPLYTPLDSVESDSKLHESGD